MKLIDTHAHVIKDSYENINEVIETINEKNLVVFNIGFDLKSSIEIKEISKRNPNILPVIGFHPVDSKDLKDIDFDNLEKLINDKIAAIGEIGLDYHYEGFDKEEQKKTFIKQIEIANKYNLPIVIHTRDSLDDCYEIIKKYKDTKFLLHSWSGDIEMTKKYLEISDNIYFSYNGILTFKNAITQKEAIKHIPINRILFETDCPYLTPVPYRGQTNYPWFVENTINYASELLNIEYKNLMQILEENTTNFYNVDKEVFNDRS